MAQPPHTETVDTIRVLHIDDEREPLWMTKKLLEMADAGLKVESVSSPMEALEMLREGGFDCVVTDFKMSPMDGIEVARSIRESSEIPIILYTGRGSEDVAVKAFAVGIDDYVRKELHPLHFEVLANRIRGVVERRWVETLYGDILEGSRDGVLLIEGTKFLYANRAQAGLFGVSDPRELIGRDALDWIVAEDLERMKGISLRLQSGEDVPSTHEYRISISGGEQRVLETSVSLINFRGRKVALAFTRDVTERRGIQEEIRESEKRYRSLFDDSPVSLWEEDFSDVKKRLDDLRESGVVDLRAYLEQNPGEVLDIISHVKITAVNKATLDMYGAEDLEELRRGFASTFTEESHAFFREEFVALSEGKTIVEGESTSVTLRGDRMHVDLRLVVPPGYEESLEKVILSVVDITESKDLAEARLEHSRELEMRVEERTRDLLDAERMAAAGSLAAMVGHDLRGPLQSIKNAAYLLRRGLRPREEALEIIDDSVDRATGMLREFRDQTHESPLSVTSIELGGLLRQAVTGIGVPGNIDASVVVDPGVEEVSLDVLKMRRVLDNLVRNAVEAMPEGGELRISGSRGERGLVIEVSDTGEGIRVEALEDLFKPFHSTKPGGMGLGLAYCKRAVEAHGGRIDVESEVDGGTTFMVLLPVA